MSSMEMLHELTPGVGVASPGAATHADAGGVKHDAGKTAWHLVPWDAMRCARVAEPYADEDDAFAVLVHWFTRSLDDAPHRASLGQHLPERVALARVARTLFVALGDDLVAVRAVADVLTVGAAKYAPRNWERGIAYSRLFSAAYRHYYASRVDGLEADPETGLHPLAHAACEVLFLLAFELRGVAALGDGSPLDDRPASLQPDAAPERGGL